MSEDSLAYKKWNCKYRIVFAPKYMRLIIYGKLRAEIIESECCLDHIHTTEKQRLIFHGYLKGKSSTSYLLSARFFLSALGRKGKETCSCVLTECL